MSESTDQSESERRAALAAEIMRTIERIGAAADEELTPAVRKPSARTRQLYPVHFFAPLN